MKLERVERNRIVSCNKCVFPIRMGLTYTRTIPQKLFINKDTDTFIDILSDYIERSFW